MGNEFRAKGVNVILGPVVGPLGRMPKDGRFWEGISNDPFLCGALAYETVSAIQGTGVITSVKVCHAARPAICTCELMVPYSILLLTSRKPTGCRVALTPRLFHQTLMTRQSTNYTCGESRVPDPCRCVELICMVSI